MRGKAFCTLQTVEMLGRREAACSMSSQGQKRESGSDKVPLNTLSRAHICCISNRPRMHMYACLAFCLVEGAVGDAPPRSTERGQHEWWRVASAEIWILYIRNILTVLTVMSNWFPLKIENRSLILTSKLASYWYQIVGFSLMVSNRNFRQIVTSNSQWQIGLMADHMSPCMYYHVLWLWPQII